MSGRLRLALGVGALVIIGPFTGLPRTQAPAPGDATRRVAERLAALRQEVDALEQQGTSVLADLRRLELERQIRAGELTAIEAELTDAGQAIVEATARATALQQTAETAQPDVEDRLVRLYKMGRAGYWRLLLDVNDMQAVGRAYRTAAALTRLDRERITNHKSTLDAIERELGELDGRTRRLAELQSRALAARAAADRAVAARKALVASIENRRELAAELAAELDAAYLRLQSTVAQRSAASGTATVPLRPFRGALPWPADGIVIIRFGRERAARVPGIEFNRNGIELSLAEGRPVTAVHDGVVTHAGPFSGLGHLVIVDHGDGAASLYGHLGHSSVNKGDRVAAGTNVGTSGRNTSGNPSLYFELRVDGEPVDPLQWLRKP